MFCDTICPPFLHIPSCVLRETDSPLDIVCVKESLLQRSWAATSEEILFEVDFGSFRMRLLSSDWNDSSFESSDVFSSYP